MCSRRRYLDYKEYVEYGNVNSKVVETQTDPGAVWTGPGLAAGSTPA